MEFSELKLGSIIRNKRSGVQYKVVEFVNDMVAKLDNLKYPGMEDYINKNTADEYELVK